MASTTVDLSLDFEAMDAPELLAWGLETYHPSLAVSVAGGAEGMVVVDMASKMVPDLRVFTLDTGKLHEETLLYFEAIEKRYGIVIERFRPDPGQLERMVGAFGEDLQFKGVNFRALCCQIRKLYPMKLALQGRDAYITGIRRSQAATRAGIAKVDIDDEHGGIVKISPLADWTPERVATYVEDHQVPTHPLFEQGYRSIGCAPCTRPVGEDEDERAGRWWWEVDAPKECGLHARPIGALDFEMSEIVGDEAE